MDFVQRNLINERNNLQIELAKAKIRIAQLNESAVEGPSTVEGLKDVVRKANKGKANLSLAGAQLAASATKELQNMGLISHDNENHHFGDVEPFKLSEQAKYISDLENVIAQLSEMRVIDSMKSGGVGSTINAVKSNIKQRGILGGLGITPKKGFVKKLGVPLVKGDDGNLSEPILGTVDKSSKGRAANRVITGAAESQIVSQASFGPANIQKVKRGETMVKKPINPHYGI
jgi:hypothetical protein